MVQVRTGLNRWGAWSDCSRKCGGGTQSRSQLVLEPAIYGGKCHAAKEKSKCNVDVTCVPGIHRGSALA